ncbi:MAG: LysR family transcriptional regulator [Streptosporangiaceae bacterium]|jgi:DNA-binding transcriptional LysR family regulator
MYDLRRLALLHDLAVFGTLVAVADVNGITASAVSQQMRRLEDETGTELLVRQGRRVKLTAAGQALADSAAEILSSLERAEGELSEIRNGMTGEVVVGAYPSVMGPVGGRLVSAVAAYDGRIRLRLVGTTPDAVVSSLFARQIDLALVLRYPQIEDPLPATVTSRGLFDERFVALVPAELEADVRERGLAALSTQQWIIGAASLSCTQTVLAACRDAGFIPEVRHQDAGYQAAATLVAAGLGVAVVPELSVIALPPHIRMLPCGVPSRRVTLVYRRGTESRLAVRAVLHAAGGLAHPGEQPEPRPQVA